MRKVLGIAILASALGAVPALAQSTPDQTKPQPKPKSTAGAKTPRQNPSSQKTTGTSGTLAPADHNFVNEAAIGGMAEVELGNLAKEKASNSDVKTFGDRMATDHGKANDELKSWAQQKNVTLPSELDAKHKAERDRLAKPSSTTRRWRSRAGASTSTTRGTSRGRACSSKRGSSSATCTIGTARGTSSASRAARKIRI